jgi:hypothetical protein
VSQIRRSRYVAHQAELGISGGHLGLIVGGLIAAGYSAATGRPNSWARDEPSMSWYNFALDYAAAKWPYSAPNHRRPIAEALTDATEAMLSRADSPYPRDEIRRALRTWAFSERLRGKGTPPQDIADVLRWLEGATIPITDLTRPGTGAIRTRALLDRISKKKDGTTAAANTANRKRAVLNNAMQYAIEIDALPANPLRAVKWTRPRTLKTVDPRAVVNSDQARRLLAAVASQGSRGERMAAFFGCMYYAALRPEEAAELRQDNLVSLPEQGWGESRTPSRAVARTGPTTAAPRTPRTQAPGTRGDPASTRPPRTRLAAPLPP